MPGPILMSSLCITTFSRKWLVFKQLGSRHKELAYSAIFPPAGRI